jgi:mono/diheme cytochrome c family protein
VAPTAPATPATTDAPKPIANTSIHDVLRMSLAFAISATQTTPPATTPPADSSKSTVTPPATTPPAIPKDLEYNKNILPILEARCWDCHGKGVAKGGVAFDHVAELIVKEPLVKSKQLPIILVGKPGSSAMMKAIQKPMTAKGHMPPKGARLTAEQIALIEAWIQQGAKVVNP